MKPRLLYQQEGPVVTITLNHPETLNALTDAEMCSEIVAAMERLNASSTPRCAILTGAGKAFSSGGNWKRMAGREGIFAGDSIAIKDNYRTGIQRVVRAVWECEVVLIAAVNGPAYGAGCDLACFCDIRIASTRAVFAENFINVGLISGDGGAWILPRQIGLSRASEMAYTAAPVDAIKALEWGLVSRVVEAEDLLPNAQELAEQISRNPARQLRMTKRLLREGMNMRLEPLLELSAAYQGLAHHTEEHEEALRALAAKRAPVFVDH